MLEDEDGGASTVDPANGVVAVFVPRTLLALALEALSISNKNPCKCRGRRPKDTYVG